MTIQNNELITGLSNGIVEVRDIISGRVINRFKAHSDQVTFTSTLESKTYASK